MGRFELLPANPSFSDPEDQQTLKRVKEQRGAAGLSKLDRALFYSPKVVNGLKAFFSSIKASSSLGEANRELAISRVGVVNGVIFEYQVHSALVLKAKDTKVTQEGVDYVKDAALGSHNLGHPGPGGLERKHITILAYVDAVSKENKVPDRVFEEVKQNFDNKQVVDLTVLIAAYNSVTKIVAPLQLFGSG